VDQSGGELGEEALWTATMKLTISLTHLRHTAIGVVVAVCAVATFGLSGLQLNSHYSAYFDSDDPLLVAHQEISDLYSRRDTMFVVLQSEGSFLDSENYRLLEDLTALLGQQRYVSSALSVTELGIIGETETEDGYFIPSLEQLTSERGAIGLLLSESTTVAGILVQIDLPDNKSRTVLDAVGVIRATVNNTIGDLPLSSHYTGTLALNEAYIDVVRHDLTRIVPLLLLVMIVVLFLLLRSALAMLAILPIGICSVLAAFGIVGLFNAELAAINSFMPVIIFSISLSGCVHLTLSFDHYRDNGLPAQEAAISAARYNLLPMSLANGTTALGFLGLTLSPSPPIRLVGLLVAAGIVVSYLLCMTLLPVLQARFDPWRPTAGPRSTFLDRLAVFVTKRRVGLVTVFLLLSLPATWFASQNVISDNVLEYFSPSHVFYQDSQLVEKQLGGVNEILYSVDTGEEFGLFSADAVEAVARLSTWLGQKPEVHRVVSVANLEAIEEATREGRLQQRLDFYRDRIDTSDDRNPLLSLEVSEDYSSSAVTVYLKQLDSARLIDFDEKVHAWAAQNLRGYTLRSGGPTLMFASLGEQNILGMLTALTIALITAALILGAVFRSGRIAFIGLVCNILPVLLVYAVWAVVNGQISIGAAVVMGMVLGIVLDDTIYLLATYRRGLQRCPDDPIAYALRHVGPALIVTTITLVAGLSLGLLSEFGPIWSMSVLSVTIISAALVVDLLLLPALLPSVGSREGET
jgi:predicted RND superfamily exporter protein